MCAIQKSKGTRQPRQRNNKGIRQAGITLRMTIIGNLTATTFIHQATRGLVVEQSAGILAVLQRHGNPLSTLTVARLSETSPSITIPISPSDDDDSLVAVDALDAEAEDADVAVDAEEAVELAVDGDAVSSGQTSAVVITASVHLPTDINRPLTTETLR